MGVIGRILAATLLAGAAAPALAEDSLVNNGTIDQVFDAKGVVELLQKQAVGSIQGVNIVGSGDRLVNGGTIRQVTRADSARLEQRQSLGSVQGFNLVVAGNPAASAFGF